MPTFPSPGTSSGAPSTSLRRHYRSDASGNPRAAEPSIGHRLQHLNSYPRPPSPSGPEATWIMASLNRYLARLQQSSQRPTHESEIKNQCGNFCWDDPWILPSFPPPFFPARNPINGTQQWPQEFNIKRSHQTQSKRSKKKKKKKKKKEDRNKEEEEEKKLPSRK